MKKCIEYIADEPMVVEGYSVLTKGMRKCWPENVCDRLIKEGVAVERSQLRDPRPVKEVKKDG